MATVPLSATSVRFISGVPFLNDYHHVRHFDTIQQQRDYFANTPTNVHSMLECAFQRSEKGAYIEADCSVDKLYSANYVIFINPEFGNKYFYGFITNLEFVNIRCTRVYIEIDVMQTWMFDYTFKPSYIERQHCKLREADGSPVINTIPEQLDFGSEYDIITEQVQYPSAFIYLVVVTSKNISFEDEGLSIKSGTPPGYVGSPSPLYYYIFPINRQTKQIPPQFAYKDAMTLSQINHTFSTDTEIVNAIQGMYLTDWCGITFNESTPTERIPANEDVAIEYIGVGGVPKACFRVDTEIDYFDGKELIFLYKYSGLPEFDETKLYMYPYTIFEMDDLKGNRLTFKGEYVNGNDIHLAVRGNVGFANRMSYELYNYNNSNGRQSSYQQAVIDVNPNDVPIVSSYLSAYLQGNKNSIQAQKQNANLRGSANMLHSFSNAVTLAASGTAVGGMAGLITATDGVIQRAVDIQATENTLMGYAQDATNVPPSVSKMGGNTSYDYGNGLNGIRIIKKQIKPEYQDILANYWNKYGYKVHRVLYPNLHTREKWNYIKTVNAIITGNINANDLRTIKTIYDNGVTLWHTNDVGNYHTTNGVIA